MTDETKEPSELFLKRVRKIVLLFRIRHGHWEQLADLRQPPIIEEDLKELVKTGFIKKGRKFPFSLTKKGWQIITLYQKQWRKLEAIFTIPPSGKKHERRVRK